MFIVRNKFNEVLKANVIREYTDSRFVWSRHEAEAYLFPSEAVARWWIQESGYKSAIVENPPEASDPVKWEARLREYLLKTYKIEFTFREIGVGAPWELNYRRPADFPLSEETPFENVAICHPDCGLALDVEETELGVAGDLIKAHVKVFYAINPRS